LITNSQSLNFFISVGLLIAANPTTYG